MNYGVYINGKWAKSQSGETFVRLNPANKRVIARFEKGDSEDVKKAVDAAEDAYHSWSSVPPPKRGLILLKIAQLLRKDKERLARIMTEEMGKVLLESRGDVQEAIDVFEYMAGEGRRLFGLTTTSELPDKFCMTTRNPVGVVGLITPWNFPIAIPAWKMSAALICGNSTVLKPSSNTPKCAVELVKIIEKAGLPKGVINMVTGSGGTVGMELVRNEKVRGISFTGNKETGKTIIREAGIKKVGLELGGKNGIIVMDDADLELALEGIVWGAFGTTGQRCTACSRVIAHEKIKSQLEEMLVERTKKLKLGNGLDKKTDVGPLVNEAAVEKSKSYVEIGNREGGKILTGGDVPDLNGFFFEPTIFTDITPDMRIAKEEIFGPVLSIISAENIEDAIEKMNKIDYGLSSSIYTHDIKNAFKAIRNIEAGIVYINSSTIGAEVHLPFGGIKQTGNGAREAGWTGIEEFSEIKTVYVDYSGKLQRAQIDVED